MKSQGWLLLLVCMLLATLILRRPLLVVLSATLAIATAASALWARYCLAGLQYRRRLGSATLGYGEETTLTLEFENAKPLPLPWLLVRDTFPPGLDLLTDDLRDNAPGEGAALVTLLSLGWYQRVSRVHRIRGSHRGRYSFGPAELASGDLFGNQRRVEPYPVADELLVFPRNVPVTALGLPAARPCGEWFAQQPVVVDPARYASVRPYVPGDNQRHVHWRATARTGELQVKQFDPSASLSITIAVDVQTLDRTYEYVPDTLEFVIMAAGSIALRALDERHMVGLCANALTSRADTWMHVRPGRHARQASELLSALAALEPFRGMPMEHMLATVQPRLPYGASVIAVTGLLRPPVVDALDTLQRAGHPVLLLTAGDAIPQVPDSIAHHHMDQQDVWQTVATLDLD